MGIITYPKMPCKGAEKINGKICEKFRIFLKKVVDLGERKWYNLNYL